ncbi:MAG: hypothetical protein J6Y78_15375 [Paludibacteraceae bacterium]|nr:hypothetical protein [Paludibacteraceae bacterium]
MSERQVKDWITINGNHIPIFEGESKQDAYNRAVAKANEDKKKTDIEKNQRESDKLNGKSRGLSDAYVVTQYPERPDKLERRIEFNEMLEKAGYFGDEKTLDDFLKSTAAWDNQKHNREMEKQNANGYEGLSFEDYLKLEPVDRFLKYLKNEEDFKKLYFSGEFRGYKFNQFCPKDTMSEQFERFFRGANESGYGRGKGARINWDNQSGFSDWLDKNPQLRLNTDKSVYRGIRLSDKGVRDLQSAFEKGSEIDFAGPSSWTLSTAVAHDFANNTLVGQRNKNLAIFEEVGGGLRNAMPFPYGHDSEVIYSGKAKFNVVDISQDKDGKYHVKVKEIR